MGPETGADICGGDRLGCLDDPLENLVQAPDGLAWRRKVTPRIVDCTLQHVETILQVVEFGSRHHEFVLRQAQFFGPLT